MKKIFILTTIYCLLFTSVVFAQGGGGTGGGGGGGTPPSGSFTLKNPFAVGDTLFQLLDTVVNKIVLPIGGMVAVLAFIYSGFLYVMAQGKPDALKKANNALLNTAIGTVLLLGSWAISGVIRNTIEQFK